MVAAFKDYIPGGAPAAPLPKAAAAASTPAPLAPRAAAPAASAPTPAPLGGRVFASPLARSLAAEKGISLDSIGAGTGMFGSVRASDLKGASAGDARAPAVAKGAAPRASAATEAGAFTDHPVSSIRGVIAKRLLQSKQVWVQSPIGAKCVSLLIMQLSLQTIPHYYLTQEIEMDTVLRLRSQFNKELEREKVKLSVNDFVIKAAAMACVRVPEANSSWMETVIRQ